MVKQKFKRVYFFIFAFIIFYKTNFNTKQEHLENVLGKFNSCAQEALFFYG